MTIRIAPKKPRGGLISITLLKVERKESLLALPRPSNVSQKPHTRKSPIFAVWGWDTTPERRLEETRLSLLGYLRITK